MTRKNKVKDRPYNHKLAVIDIVTIEDFLDDIEYTDLIGEDSNLASSVTLSDYTQTKEAIIRLKKWLVSRV